MTHPMFQPQPNGERHVLAADGTRLPVIPVNVQMEVTMTTAIIGPQGPTVMPVIDALSLQTTLAAHWYQKTVKQDEEIANLRAKLNEASGEGRVYELDAEIRITPEDFADLKDLEKAVAEELDCTSAEDVRELAKLGRMSATRPLPGELEVALRALGVTTIGGFREFLEHYKIPVPEVAR